MKVAGGHALSSPPFPLSSPNFGRGEGAEGEVRARDYPELALMGCGGVPRVPLIRAKERWNAGFVCVHARLTRQGGGAGVSPVFF